MKQDYGLYGNMLSESYNYKGDWFWENFIFSNMIKNLPSEIKEFGNRAVVESYGALFGEKAEELLEYVVEQDIDVLTEASKIKTSLLFESYGERDIKHYLAERFPFPNNSFSPDKTPNFGIFPEAGALSAARGTMAKQYAVGGFISKAWEKLKSLGRAVFAPILPYLQRGLSWAKDLAQQGLAWFNRTPWAKALLPLLLIVGTVRGVVKLVNRVRRKKVSPEEQLELKNFAMKNNTKINEQRKKVNLPPIKV
jgi:hypothetical protein